MKKFLALLLCGGLLAGCGQSGSPSKDTGGSSEGVVSVPSETHLESTFEEGKLFRAGNINIVVLKGSFYEMGQQYGSLLKTSLNDFYKAAWDGLSQQEQAEILALIEELSAGYSARHMEILEGMATTSGMTVTQLMVLDQLLVVTFFGFSCSFVATWGPYTADSGMLVGRNFDWGKDFVTWSPHTTVTVYNPTSGGHSCATIGYPGMINGLTGINDAGLLIEMNNGSHSLGEQFFLHYTNYLNSMLGFLWDSGDLKTLGKMIETTRPQSPVIINTADEKQAYSYETVSFDTRRREANKPGLLVATNQYMSPSWGILNLPTTTQSSERYANLLKLAEAEKGNIDVEGMKAIMDTPLDDGGATLIPGKIAPTNPDLTLYQVVACLPQKKIWVKTPNYPSYGDPSWTEIDLGLLFANNSG